MATRVACTAAPGPGSPRPRVWGASAPRARAADPCASSRATCPRQRDDRAIEAETLDAFATRVCQRVGRGEEDARDRAHARANWFETAEDVASLTVDQLVAMGVPARWGRAMRRPFSRGDGRRAPGVRPPRPAPRPRGRGARTGGSAGRCPAPTSVWSAPPRGARRNSPGTGSNQIVSAGASGTRERASAGPPAGRVVERPRHETQAAASVRAARRGGSRDAAFGAGEDAAGRHDAPRGRRPRARADHDGGELRRGGARADGVARARQARRVGRRQPPQ